MKTTRKGILATVAAAGLLLLAGAGAASAHVTVSPTTAAPGSYATLTFQVPTESDTASTTRLAVYFPTDTPLASVSVQPHPGWHFQVSTTKLATPITSDDGQVSEAVSRILWTADSPKTAIAPGEFDTFSVAAGPLPAGGTLTFKALQYYSDGSIVRWIDVPEAGQPEPDHPAPRLTIAANVEAPSAATSGTSSTSGTSGSARVSLLLSILALALAGAGAIAGFTRRRT